MYRGKKCSLERRDSETYVYRDAETIATKRRKEMMDFVQEKLDLVRTQLEELSDMVALLSMDEAPKTGVRIKRFAPGASGLPDMPPGTPKPIPLPDTLGTPFRKPGTAGAEKRKPGRPKSAAR